MNVLTAVAGRVIAAILFEATMDREFDGMPAPSYLWEKKQVVPLLKCDKGLADEENGCQVMKEIEGVMVTRTLQSFSNVGLSLTCIVRGL